MNKPLVSVIINCYNGEKYLNEAISSAINQSYKNIEIIFWDNQSTDSSKAIVNSFDDGRIRYFYAKTFTKLYEARDLAIKESKGDFITFLDVDDFWDHEKLDMQIKHFDNPNTGIVCSNFNILNQKTKSYSLAHKNEMKSGNVINDLLNFYYVGLVTIMIRKSAYIDSGNYCNKDFHIIGDFDLVMRICKINELRYLNVPLATYRSHENSESKKHLYMQAQELRKWHEENKNDQIFTKYKNMDSIIPTSYYLEGLSFILGNKRIRSLKFLRFMRKKDQLKIMILFFLPSLVIKMLRR